MERTSHQLDRRQRHAAAFLTLVNPLTAAVTIVYVLINALVADEALLGAQPLAIYAILPLVIAAIIGARIQDPVIVIQAFALLLVPVVLTIVWLDPEPASTSAVLLVPVLLLAYFARPWLTIVATALIAVMIALMRWLHDAWDAPDAIPVAVYVVLITGGVLAFTMHQARTAEDELAAEVAQRDQRLQSPTELEQARERLIATVSHELRTPLTSTLGSIKTLLRSDIELTGERRERLLVAAHEGGERLRELVEDLLSLDATTPESVRRHAERIDVRELLFGAIAGIESAQGREIRIHIGASGHAPVQIEVDRRRMQQVVANLVRNAIHHGAGTVDIEVRDIGNEIAIDVLDEGSGIAPVHVKELFRPFARFSDRSDSTGLGLAISRAIVEAHGGTLRYDRTADSRSRFRVRVPN